KWSRRKPSGHCPEFAPLFPGLPVRLVHIVATKFKIRSNLHLFEPPRAPRTQKGNPSRHLESENLKSRILDPDGRPSTKGFIRQALSALCVLGGSPFFGSRRYEVARYHLT